jgi:hypothetical protein
MLFVNTHIKHARILFIYGSFKQFNLYKLINNNKGIPPFSTAFSLHIKCTQDPAIVVAV